MATWTHRTIIVPDAVDTGPPGLRGPSRRGRLGMYSVPLSPTGELPATYRSAAAHWRWIADLLQPGRPGRRGHPGRLDPAPLVAIVMASDITDDPADVALARLWLQLPPGGCGMKQFLIAIDQLANTVAGGYADETLSASGAPGRGGGWSGMAAAGHQRAVFLGAFTARCGRIAVVERRQLPSR